MPSFLFAKNMARSPHALERRLRISTFALVLGLLLAGLVLAFGELRYSLKSRHLSTLQIRCEKEREKLPATQGIVLPCDVPIELPPESYTVPLTQLPPKERAEVAKSEAKDEHVVACDDLPDDLFEDGLQCLPKDVELHAVDLENEPSDVVATPERPLFGIQREIHQQFNSRVQGWDGAKNWALLIAVVFSIPRAWYFVLKRVEELSYAIRGKD
jgi:hypothetical protein